MTRRLKVKTPYTTAQLHEKMKKTKVVMPKAADELPLDDAEPDFNNPQFSSVEFGGVFSFTDSVGVDGNGKEYKFPGGTGFIFNWTAPGIGFGEIKVKLLSDGTLEVDSERLGKEFVKKALCAMIDSAKDRDEKVN